MGRLNYVYIVFRQNGIPLYVGKGSGRRWKCHYDRARANRHYGRALKAAGGDLPTSIVARNLTEKEAYALESLLTWMIGIESEGGPLVNCGHGGRGGPAGVKRSKEWRANRRLKAIEVWRDETYRAKMLRPDRGRSGNYHPRSAEFKSAVSVALKGNQHTLGFKHSEESKALMRTRWADPEWYEREMDRRRASGMYSTETAKKGWAARRAKAMMKSE